MNKYQQVLDRLKTNNYLTSREQREYYNLLQELVDKETPMKPIDKYTEKVRDYLNEDSFIYVNFETGYCPNCNEEVNENYTYCNNCGQRLDWSDSE